MASDVPGPARSMTRRFTLGRGPLRRGSDRVQVASRVLLLLVVLLSVPVALTVGTVVRGDLLATAEREAGERSPTQAVATEDASASYGTGAAARAVVAARWTAPDGTEVEGDVRGPAGTRPGDVVEIWVTADGRSVDPPMSGRQATLSAVVLATVGWFGALAAAGGGHAAVCWLLDRHRDREWTRGWAAVEPTWTRRVP
ncbi:hypothetical protein GCU56_00040 [Geodermatophilus sabuli]|uniref:Uncharacterized protein n=1 Tax=Geodermatophilus sabuli TaxID=1564158 RepID=A0A7K3VVZ1_9ACTN|nr:hypothetical protein [Geodermatophilus sabuli]NEK56263.1 hypothetical protein [Geodermatophilus sabuli]